jgi:PQQ-like domain
MNIPRSIIYIILSLPLFCYCNRGKENLKKEENPPKTPAKSMNIRKQDKISTPSVKKPKQLANYKLKNVANDSRGESPVTKAGPPKGMGRIFGIAVSQDGKQTASGGSNGKIHLYSNNKKQIVDLKRGEVWSIAYSPDGNHLFAVTDQVVVKIDTRTGKTVWEHKDQGLWKNLALSPDGSSLAIASHSPTTPTSKALYFMDIKTGKIIKKTSIAINRLQYSKDNKHLFVRTNKGFAILNAKTLKKTKEIPAVLGASFVVNATNTRLAICDHKAVVTVFSLPEGKQIYRFPISSGGYGGQPLSFNTRGTMLAVGGRIGTVWNIISGMQITTLPKGLITSLVFIPGKDKIVIGFNRGTLTRVNVVQNLVGTKRESYPPKNIVLDLVKSSKRSNAMPSTKNRVWHKKGVVSAHLENSWGSKRGPEMTSAKVSSFSRTGNHLTIIVKLQFKDNSGNHGVDIINLSTTLPPLPHGIYKIMILPDSRKNGYNFSSGIMPLTLEIKK